MMIAIDPRTWPAHYPPRLTLDMVGEVFAFLHLMAIQTSKSGFVAGINALRADRPEPATESMEGSCQSQFLVDSVLISVTLEVGLP